MSKQIVTLSAEAYQKLGDFLTQLPYKTAAPVINFLNSEAEIVNVEEEESDNDTDGTEDT